jgi:hypothetical protein
MTVGSIGVMAVRRRIAAFLNFLNRLFALTPHRMNSFIADRFRAFLCLILGIRQIAVVFRLLRPLG